MNLLIGIVLSADPLARVSNRRYLDISVTINGSTESFGRATIGLFGEKNVAYEAAKAFIDICDSGAYNT